MPSLWRMQFSSVQSLPGIALCQSEQILLSTSGIPLMLWSPGLLLLSCLFYWVDVMGIWPVPWVWMRPVAGHMFIDSCSQSHCTRNLLCTSFLFSWCVCMSTLQEYGQILSIREQPTAHQHSAECGFVSRGPWIFHCKKQRMEYSPSLERVLPGMIFTILYPVFFQPWLLHIADQVSLIESAQNQKCLGFRIFLNFGIFAYL